MKECHQSFTAERVPTSLRVDGNISLSVNTAATTKRKPEGKADALRKRGWARCEKTESSPWMRLPLRPGDGEGPTDHLANSLNPKKKKVGTLACLNGFKGGGKKTGQHPGLVRRPENNREGYKRKSQRGSVFSRGHASKGKTLHRKTGCAGYRNVPG